MPKLIDYALPPGGTIVQLADNISTALEIEGADAKDYIVVKTTDGSEAINISAGSAGVQINESGQMKSTASGGWMLISSDPTDTVPNIMPSMADPNTGIGHYGGTSDSDALSLIAGGVEGIRITEDTTILAEIKGRTVITADTSGTPDDLGDFDNYALVLQGSSNTNDETALLLSGSSNTYGGSAVVHKDTGAGGKGELSFYTKQSTAAEPPVKVMTLTDSGGVVIAGAISHTGALDVNGDLSTQGAGTLESISTATVTGSGTSFTTVLQAGDAIKFTNDADATEIRTVKQINSNTELILTETPGATGAGRSTEDKAYFIDPALLSIKTGDAVSKLSAKNSGIGINVADPDFPLHVVGPGGGQDLSGVTGAAVAEGKFSAMFDNSTANGSDRNIVGINTNGAGGSILSLYRNGAESGSFFSYGASGTYLDAKNGALHLRTTASHLMDFFTNNARRMGIDADGAVWVGGTATSNNSKEFEVNNGGAQCVYTDIGGTDSYLIISGNANSVAQALNIGSSQRTAFKVSKYGAAQVQYTLGSNDTWDDNQTNATRPAYLADSNTDLILDYGIGNVGIITLVDNIDKIKFYNVPQVGSAMNFTLRIKQHASSAKTVSYSTVEFYTDAGSTAVSSTKTLTWAGGVAHTMSTGVDDYDIVQFTGISDTVNTIGIYGSVVGQNFS